MYTCVVQGTNNSISVPFVVASSLVFSCLESPAICQENCEENPRGLSLHHRHLRMRIKIHQNVPGVNTERRLCGQWYLMLASTVGRQRKHDRMEVVD